MKAKTFIIYLTTTLLLICVGIFLGGAYSPLSANVAQFMPSISLIIGLSAVTLFLLAWVNGTRVRRLEKQFRNRPKGDLPDDFVAILAQGLSLPLTLVQRFTAQDTLVSIYLLMYPEHCMYDSHELENTQKLLHQQYALKIDNALLNEPLGALAMHCHTTSRGETCPTSQ